MRYFWLFFVLFVLVACNPREPIDAKPDQATFTLEQVGDEYQFTLLIADPTNRAVCVDGADGVPICPTFTLAGEGIATENPDCAPHPTQADVLRCRETEPIVRGYRVTVTSNDPPVGVAYFYLERDKSQPLYLEARL